MSNFDFNPTSVNRFQATTVPKRSGTPDGLEVPPGGPGGVNPLSQQQPPNVHGLSLIG